MASTVDYASPGGYWDNIKHQALKDARLISNQTAIELALDDARRHEEERMAVKRIKCEYCNQTADSNTETHCPGCGAGLPVDVFTQPQQQPYGGGVPPAPSFVTAMSTASMVVMDTTGGMW